MSRTHHQSLNTAATRINRRTYNISTLLVLFGVLLTSNIVKSEALHSPLRLRFNTDLLKGIFYRKDQELLNIFSNMTLGSVDLSTEQQAQLVEDLQVSLTPVDGINFDDFDFNLSFDENDFIGMESKQLRVVGNGFLRVGQHEENKTEEFQISAPVDEFRFEYNLSQNGSSKAVQFNQFKLLVDPAKIQITHQGDIKFLEDGQNLDKVKQTISEEINRLVNQIKNDTMSGNLTYLQKLPILNLTPLIALYHTTNTAENVQFAGDYLEYDFSPASFKVLNEEDEDFLKPIEHEFAALRDDKGQRAFQLVLDENLPNGFASQLISSKRKMSLREMLSIDPRFALFRQLMTTSTFGMAIPTLKEEYGENKNVDVIFTISNDWIKEIVEGMTPSGVSLDAKGNFKIFMNVGAQVIIEKKKGNWDDSRKMIMTLGLKGKIFVADSEFENRTLVILPRGIELSNLKIFKGDEEQFLEQMLVQSLIGVQLDQFKKQMKPQIFPLKDFNNPPELQCFGFNLTNLDVFVNKGYIQINSNYIKIDREELSDLRKSFCDAFENTLKSSPERFQDMLGHYIPGLSHLKKTGDAFSNEKELKRQIKEQENPNRKSVFKTKEPAVNLPEDVAKDLLEEEELEKKANARSKYAKYAKQNIESSTQDEL